MANYDILWSYEAENDLDDVFEYYFQKSQRAAYTIIADIIEAVESLVFSE